MKPFFKLSLCAVMLTTLVACSNPGTYRQASDSFQYLNASPLKDWQSLPDQKTEFSGIYEIPTRNYKGFIGADVDIRPPQQVFELISGMRYKRGDNSIVVWIPGNNNDKRLGEAIEHLVSVGTLPVRTMEASGVDTDWVKWTTEDDGEIIETRHFLRPVKEKMRNGFSVEMLELKQNGILLEDTPALRERYNTLMANLITTHFDQKLREDESLLAQKRVKNIPITLGTDRSALPVIIARAPYSVFWERLPAMLNTLGFSVEDRNHSQGTLELKYKKPDDEMWTALGIEPLPFDRKNYTIQLGDLGNRTSINLSDKAGKPVNETVLANFSQQLAAVVAYLNK